MICNQLKESLFFRPSPLNKQSFLQVSRPAFSLGSLPGKQEKHLNQWKMCLIVLGSTALFLQRYKTLQPHQETTEWTLMKWGVKSRSNEKKAGLIMAGGGFYGAFNVRSLIHGCWWKKLNWQNRLLGSVALWRIEPKQQSLWISL